MPKVSTSARTAVDEPVVNVVTNTKGKGKRHMSELNAVTAAEVPASDPTPATTETEVQAQGQAQGQTQTQTQGDGDVDFSAFVGQVIEIPPEDVVVDEALNVRLGEVDTEGEQKRIEKLARMIKEDGQLQEAGVVPVMTGTGEVEYHLFFGNRRRAAIAYLNSQEKKQRTLRVRVFAPEEVRKLRRKAIRENIARKSFSAMDLAYNIQAVRKENGWETGKDTRRVADYFGVSPALITEHEKLLTASPEVQARMSELEMRSDPAQFLVKEVAAEKQAEVLAQAEEIAKAESAKPAPTQKGKSVSGEPAPASASSSPSPASSPAPAKTQVQKKHVVQAARGADALLKPETKRRSRTEILDHIREIAESPAYGYANSPVRSWADYFVNKFAEGTVSTDRGLLQKFDEMVLGEDGLYPGEGTPSKAEQEEMDAEEAKAKEKAQAKAAAEKAKGSGKSKPASSKPAPKAKAAGSSGGSGKK